MNYDEIDESVKDGLNKVLGTALGVAREQLEEQGVFLPFAIGLEPSTGQNEPELRLLAVPPAEDPEDPEADIDTEAMANDLVQVLNKEGANFVAVAIASDVLLTDDNQDAIHVVAEHQDGAAVAVVQAYQMPDEPGGKWNFAEPAAEPAEQSLLSPEA